MGHPGYPTTWQETYLGQPYHFPLSETYPLVRVPVAGPDPFNTLVIVRGRTWVDFGGWASGKIKRHRVRTPTPFKLVGHDPRVAPAYQHSTVAAINMVQSSEDTEFLTAVDAVTGEFDDEGRWIVIADCATAWWQVYASTLAYFSSWVLCYEPPLPEGTTSTRSEARGWTPYLDEPLPSTADDAVARRIRRSYRKRTRALLGGTTAGSQLAGPDRDAAAGPIDREADQR
jgi:hypothetical protein